MTQQTRHRGRPAVAPENRLEQRSIRLTASQWNKVDAAGGVAWLRKLIDLTAPVIVAPSSPSEK